MCLSRSLFFIFLFCNWLTQAGEGKDQIKLVVKQLNHDWPSVRIDPKHAVAVRIPDLVLVKRATAGVDLSIEVGAITASPDWSSQSFGWTVSGNFCQYVWPVQLTGTRIWPVCFHLFRALFNPFYFFDIKTGYWTNPVPAKNRDKVFADLLWTDWFELQVSGTMFTNLNTFCLF